ncbi:MAG: hypothetical protein ACTSYI_09790 [Promethearchaeota archaeon]
MDDSQLLAKGLHLHSVAHIPLLHSTHLTSLYMAPPHNHIGRGQFGWQY